jgi:hypothetical protein
MMLDVLVLPANLSRTVAARRLRNLPRHGPVVLVREDDGRTLHYVSSLAAIRRALVASGRDGDLQSLLDLLKRRHVTALQMSEFHETDSRRSRAVVLDGSRVVGLHPGTRSGSNARRPPSMIMGPTTLRAMPTASPEPETGEFRAYPSVKAPDAVVGGEEFEVSVGFTLAGAAKDEVVLSDVPRIVVFTVQIAGIGFTFPSAVRRPLRARRDDPERVTVKFKVRADVGKGDVLRVLNVSFDHEGNLCGHAWREVRVNAHKGAAATARPRRPRTGGARITENSGDLPAPHLTVHIISKQAEPVLQWRFTSPYSDLGLPIRNVEKRLDEGSSREFAIQLITGIPPLEKTELLGNTVQGMGRLILPAMPLEFWTVLTKVLKRCKETGEAPTVLLVTNEPWVPWELAWVTRSLVPPELLPPGIVEGPLAALWQVGRWLQPVVQGSKEADDLPPPSPQTTMEFGRMAVVQGDYASNPLKGAAAESKQFAAAYGAVSIDATEHGLAQLLNNLSVDGSGALLNPSFVHVAAHGQVRPQAQQYDGIVLSDTLSDTRSEPLVLGPPTVLGAPLWPATKPFVFLNACEVGAAGWTLSEFGGMPGAFITAGCRAFIGPLWAVNDLVAHNFAVAFYERVLGQQMPVAAALMELRRWFGTDQAASTATPLAYIFYGHPALRIRHTQDQSMKESP